MNATTTTSPAYCDRCPARARMRAELPAGELHFCGHHAREHRDRLAATGATIVILPGRPSPILSRAADRAA
jgi:hypothetical protein